MRTKWECHQRTGAGVTGSRVFIVTPRPRTRGVRWRRRGRSSASGSRLSAPTRGTPQPSLRNKRSRARDKIHTPGLSELTHYILLAWKTHKRPVNPCYLNLESISRQPQPIDQATSILRFPKLVPPNTNHPCFLNFDHPGIIHHELNCFLSSMLPSSVHTRIAQWEGDQIKSSWI